MADGHKSDSEIAKKLGVTKKTVEKNYDAMKENGIITGATIHINYKIFGYRAVAHVLINVDPQQEELLIGYLQKMPEVFSFYKRGVKGNIDVIIILRTLEQLNEVKDDIKRHFSVLEMRTAIWTDVKEMNDNLAIIQGDRKGVGKSNLQITTQKRSPPQTIVIDQIDQKIADKLSENGRLSMESLGKEIGVSSATAKRKYEKLRKNGVLKVTIQISPIKIGYQAICVFFAVTSVTSNEESFSIIDKISKIPDVISIMKTTGDYDLQIWAMVKDIAQLLSIQDELRNITKIKKVDLEILRMREKWPTPRQHISTF